VAKSKQRILGTHRKTATNGSITFLGFRLRDDQAASLGYEERHCFDILATLGAYAPTGLFPGVNDNPDYVSRTSDTMVCRFPNGAIAVAPHLRNVEECWPGGFARKPEEDKEIAAKLTLPSIHLSLRGFKAAGMDISYEGDETVAFRTNDQNELIAFAGKNCTQIAVNGRTTVFADQAMACASWTPIPPERRVENGAVLEMFFLGAGKVHIPAPGLAAAELFVQGPTPGSRGNALPCTIENGTLVFDVPADAGNRWIYAVPKTP
jgi:hypothetical protein